MREGKPYLIRITLFSCKYFTIKLHKTLMSDPADLHDHPWNYISLILWGGYFEETQRVKPFKQINIRTWYKPLSILVRSGDTPHRLILPENKYCITLIFTTRKWRDWGFIKNNSWISHKETKNLYSKAPEPASLTFIRERYMSKQTI